MSMKLETVQTLGNSMRKYWNMVNAVARNGRGKKFVKEYWASQRRSDKGEERELIAGKTKCTVCGAVTKG